MSVSSIASNGWNSVASAAGGAARSGGNAFAELFEQARGAKSSEVNSATTGSSIAELTRNAETSFSEFKRAMQQLLNGAGIDTTWQINLRDDGHGGIAVDGDHPQADEITRLLQQNPDLIEKFQQVKQAYEQLRSGSGEKSAEDELLSPTFSMVFTDETAQVHFE